MADPDAPDGGRTRSVTGTCANIICVGIWILLRFIDSLRSDLSVRQLSLPTILWGAPIAVVLAAGTYAAMTPRYSYASAGNGGRVTNSTPRPTAKATTRPTYAPGAMVRLRALLPPVLSGHCHTYVRNTNDKIVRGAVAGLVCHPADPKVAGINLFLFPDVETLKDWWPRRMDQMSVDLESEGSCADGDFSDTRWARGSFACYSSNVGHIRWTDETDLVYGALDMRKKGMQPALAWWRPTSSHESRRDGDGGGERTPAGSSTWCSDRPVSGRNSQRGRVVTPWSWVGSGTRQPSPTRERHRRGARGERGARDAQPTGHERSINPARAGASPRR